MAFLKKAHDIFLARQKLSRSALMVLAGMMKLTRGRLSEPDDINRVWLKPAANSNQLCLADLCRRNVMNHIKNRMENAMPAATGIVCSNAAGDLPRNNSVSQ